MTGRAVPEWIGKTPETRVPDRVKLRIVLRQDGKCALSETKFRPGDKIEYDHDVALINGGENRESNLQAVLSARHKEKTKADVKQKAKDSRIRQNHLGIKTKKTTMAGSKASKWRKPLNGPAVLRNPK